MTSLLICSGHIADILLVLEQWQISLSRLDGCNVHPACDRQDKIRTPKQKAFIKRQNMAAVGLRSAPVSTPPGFPSTTWLQLCYMPVGCSIENLIRGALPIPTSVESKLDELRSILISLSAQKDLIIQENPTDLYRDVNDLSF
ncbi:hypothetical protein GUJ93_ZPchr0013g36220 [Zizania palustris]|uniref:Uncharacterized protein n=1 Tax=Zizania palustris TaxID=103762 RepID=A0A8J5X1A8_ZIZPA|nr:hypothetical protein GUJ93_ZPchr0013g36220 [Zizania palustris]